MALVVHDLRFAVRSLRRSRGFTAAAVATLALGIGLATASFTLLERVVLDGLPYPAASRLVTVRETDAHNDSFSEGFSGPDFRDLQTRAHSFDAAAALSFPQFNLRVGDQLPERIDGGAATASLLPLLGARPVMGRLFAAAEDVPNGPRVAVLADDLWRRALGGDLQVIGRTIRLDGQPYEVVGVLAPGFHFEDAELFVPMNAATPFLDLRGVHNLRVVARLRPGVPLARGEAEVGAIAGALAHAYPDDNVGRGFRLQPLRATLLGGVARELWILAGAVGLVLLIACANVAGLWLVRAHGRRREIAVRRALGASGRQLGTQLVVEVLVLSAASCAVALAVAQGALRGLLALRGEQLPHGVVVHLDARAVPFSGGCALLTALLFGVAPLLRRRSGDARGALGRSAADAAMRPRARAALVVAEVALAMVLVTGSALLGGSVWRLLQVEPGFTSGHVVSFGIQLPDARYPMPPRDQYPQWPQVVAAYQRLEEHLAALPGVRRVALALDHPLEHGFTTQVGIVGRPLPPGPHDEVRVRPVTPGYQEMLRVPLLAGRGLEPADRAGAAAVTLVNAAFARRYFPRSTPLGHSVSFWAVSCASSESSATSGFAVSIATASRRYYPSLEQLPFASFRILVDASVPVAVLDREVRGAVAGLEPDVALYDVRPLTELLAESLSQRRFLMALLASSGTLSLVLAAVGIYGLIAFQVAQRRRELGVRQALGASRGRLMRLVVGEGARLAALGVLLGGIASALLAPALAAQLFGVQPLDPVSLALAALLLGGVGIAAATIPALRAGRGDLMPVLREE